MRRIVCLFLMLMLCFSTSQTVFGEDAVETSKEQDEEKPTVAARAAILMDAKTGRILWEKNAHEPLSMASTTKIMTAVLALESGRKEEYVTVSRRAAAAPKMKMNLSPGEKIRLYDLMQALMLESSNDAAVAIAEHLGGSVQEFCQMMTDKAKEIGAKDTIYETPNGLDAGNHHSTAYDLAIITRYALEVPGFIELTNTTDAKFSSDRKTYAMMNKSRLLREYEGANGVKTGFTNLAGHCFVGAAKRDDMQLISVVLASGWGEKGKAMKWVDTKEVLNYGFGNFEYETIITDGDIAGTVPITRSRTTMLKYVFDESLTIPLSNAEKEEVKIQVPESLQAPVTQDQAIGEAQVFVNGQLYTTIPLTVTGEALRHDFKTSLEKVLNEWVGQVTAQTVNLILPEPPQGSE